MKKIHKILPKKKTSFESVPGGKPKSLPHAVVEQQTE